MALHRRPLRVGCSRGESSEQLLAWRRHPEHLEAMRIGRERFYTEYGSYVCEPARKSRFNR